MVKLNVSGLLSLAILLPSTNALPFNLFGWGGKHDDSSLQPQMKHVPSGNKYPTLTVTSTWGVFPTGTAPGTTGTGTGICTSTGLPYPTAPYIGIAKDKHEQDHDKEHHKRPLEGPRRHHFPHHYPFHHPYGGPWPTAAPTGPTVGPTGSAPVPTGSSTTNW